MTKNQEDKNSEEIISKIDTTEAGLDDNNFDDLANEINF